MLIHNGEHEDISITFYLWTLNCLFPHCECLCCVIEKRTARNILMLKSVSDFALLSTSSILNYDRKVKISCTKDNITKMESMTTSECWLESITQILKTYKANNGYKNETKITYANNAVQQMLHIKMVKCLDSHI